MAIKPGLLCLKVIPHAAEEKLIEEQGTWKLYLKAAPEKGRANHALIKFFKKNYRLDVRIEKGKTSRRKMIRILP